MTIKLNLPLAPQSYSAPPYDDILRVLRLGFNQIHSANIDFLQSGSNVKGRSVQDKLREVVSVKDFGALGDGTTDDTSAIQAAVNSVATNAFILFPAGGNYVIRNKVTITTDGLTLYGPGAKLTTGAGETAGTRILEVNANRFTADGFYVVDGGTKTVPFAVVPTTTKSGFTFANLTTENCFYAVRMDGDTGKLVKDAVVYNVTSKAPGGGVAAGHILGDFADNVTVMGCKTRLGTNSSQIGFADSTNISIIGNRCFENEDLDAADAAIQIEDSPGANAVIVGNVCDHDIWVDDSTYVSIGANTARRLRFTVTERDNTKISCVGGAYNRIQITSIGTPGAFRTSATFSGMTLDPAGDSETFGIFASGAFVGDVKLSNIDMISNGSTANLNFSRDAGATLRIRNCDFNGGTITFSGAGGTINIRDNVDYITEASGTGTITSAATSATITHGLSRTPSIQDITVTGGENPTTDVGTIWVDTITSTQFNVNCEVAPGASNFDFGWKAIITRTL